MESTYCIYNKTRESFLGLNVACASTSLSRFKSLLGKVRMNSGEGLWLVPFRGIRSVGALFPVDLVYLDGGNNVVHLVEHLRWFRFSSGPLNCASVLELPAHTIFTSQTRVGDVLLICPPEEMNRQLSNIGAAKVTSDASDTAHDAPRSARNRIFQSEGH